MNVQYIPEGNGAGPGGKKEQGTRGNVDLGQNLAPSYGRENAEGIKGGVNVKTFCNKCKDHRHITKDYKLGN